MISHFPLPKQTHPFGFFLSCGKFKFVILQKFIPQLSIRLSLNFSNFSKCESLVWRIKIQRENEYSGTIFIIIGSHRLKRKPDAYWTWKTASNRRASIEQRPDGIFPEHLNAVVATLICSLQYASYFAFKKKKKRKVDEEREINRERKKGKNRMKGQIKYHSPSHGNIIRTIVIIHEWVDGKRKKPARFDHKETVQRCRTNNGNNTLNRRGGKYTINARIVWTCDYASIYGGLICHCPTWTCTSPSLLESAFDCTVPDLISEIDTIHIVFVT